MSKSLNTRSTGHRRNGSVLPVVSLSAAPATDPTPAAPPAQPQRQTVKMRKSEAVALATGLLKKAGIDLPEIVALAGKSQTEPAPTDPTNQPSEVALRDNGVIAEEQRRKVGIESLCNLYPLKKRDEFVHLAIASNWDIPTTRTKALEKLAAEAKPLEGLTTIDVGADQNLVSLSGAIGTALRLRAGAKIDRPKDAEATPVALAAYDRAQKLRGLSLVEMGRQYLSAIGYADAFMISKPMVVSLCVNPVELRRQPNGGRLVMLAESIGDFPGVLKDAINKSLLQAYRDAAPTWQMWARRATNPDFKTINRVALSESPDLVKRDQGKGVDYVTLSDTNETYALAEYTNGIKLTRQAMINDDLDAFQRIPMAQGNAASRKEEDVAYSILTTNANMINDNGALFNSTAVTSAGGHANYDSSGAAPSVSELSKGFTRIRKQKGPAGAARLNLQPKFILVPVALEAGTLQLVHSQQLIPLNTTAGATSQGATNPYANRLQVVTNPRLDDNSATVWYLAADYRDGQVDTIEVCFLEDEPEPVLKQETDFDTDDQKFAVRHTVAAKAVDWRGLYKNAGA